MTAARKIIERFGGLSSLAHALGHSHPTTVQGWGERGVIPVKRIPEVIAAARSKGFDLTYADFFDEPETGRPGRAA